MELPRDNLVRAVPVRAEVRDAEDGGTPMLFGHFARFNQWNEIDSVYEGRFLERVAPGAYKKTFQENGQNIRALFQHGRDPVIGDKPIAALTTLREDEEGPYYEGPMLDTAYARELVPGLKAGVYGASYRFRVTEENVVERPERSDYNPEGLPERTIVQAQVMEVGPVTFPADAGATASVRSLTDWYRDTRSFDESLKEAAQREPSKLARKIEASLTPAAESAGSSTEAQQPVTAQERTKPMAVDIDRFQSETDLSSRLEDIKQRQDAMNTEWGTREFDTTASEEWEGLKEERTAIERRLQHLAERKAQLEEVSRRNTVEGNRFTETVKPFQTIRTPDDPYDTPGVYRDARSPQDAAQKFRDNARRVIEGARFPHPEAKQDAVREHVENVIESSDKPAAVAEHILNTGSPAYRAAFSKYLSGAPLSERENELLYRAMSLTAANGGYAVPYVLDPTILPTSNLAVNPFRAIARVEQITVDEWRGISSGGITAAFAAEATETTDNAPTLAQPTVSTEKAQAFIPFSIEIGQDWDGLQTQMAGLLQDAKDELEASKFATGTGTNEPQGVITGATTTTTLGGTASFAIGDLDLVEAALPPRFRPRASWVMNRAIAQKVRHFDTAGGASVWNQGVQLQVGLPNNVPTGGSYAVDVLGYPAYESTAMASALTTGSKIVVLGDFNYYLIADRVGLSVELINHLVGSNHRPTGQRGLYAYWRVGAGVLSAAAFRVGVTG